VALDAALDDELQALDERACELCVFTSGSTGQPSAIGKRLDQLAREVEALQAAFGAQLEGVQVHGTVSHQHIYGLLFRVLWPLAAGRLIHPRRFFHEDLVGALAGTDTVLVATPAHLKRLPEQLDWASLHGRLRAVFLRWPAAGRSGTPGAAVAGRGPTEVYGSSETGGIAWRRWDTDLPPWQPLPGVQWRIDDGCLAVASAHLDTLTGGAPRTAWKPGRWPLPPAGPGRPHRQDRGTPRFAGCAGTRAARRRRGG
jgi:acyl-coenzyme A synthetase/AMP-(fatty) acid ligase